MKNSSSSSWASAGVQSALGQVGLQVGPEILVEPAQPAMVVPAQPENGVAQAQRLERLAEASGGMGRRTLQRLGDVVPAQGPGHCGVAAGQFQHGVDGLHRGVQEDLRFLVARQAGPGGLGRRSPRQQALAQDHAPVGADVADGPELVEGAPGAERVHLLRAVQGRNPPHRPGEHDALIRLDHDGLGLAQAPGQPGRPPGPVQTLELAFG